MTDPEVICTWMEPDAPANGGIPNSEILKKFSPKGWWRYNGLACNWKLPILIASQDKRSLFGYLWEVEDRLTDDQWREYANLMMDPAGIHHTRFLLHATPGQKIKALAAVLRQSGQGSEVVR